MLSLYGSVESVIAFLRRAHFLFCPTGIIAEFSLHMSLFQQSLFLHILHQHHPDTCPGWNPSFFEVILKQAPILITHPEVSALEFVPETDLTTIV
jgi:hypothetical protein